MLTRLNYREITWRILQFKNSGLYNAHGRIFSYVPGLVQVSATQNQTVSKNNPMLIFVNEVVLFDKQS